MMVISLILIVTTYTYLSSYLHPTISVYRSFCLLDRQHNKNLFLILELGQNFINFKFSLFLCGIYLSFWYSKFIKTNIKILLRIINAIPFS